MNQINYLYFTERLFLHFDKQLPKRARICAFNEHSRNAKDGKSRHSFQEWVGQYEEANGDRRLMNDIMEDFYDRHSDCYNLYLTRFDKSNKDLVSNTCFLLREILER